MSPFSLPIRRPVATAMFFLGLFLLGAVAWHRIPIELLPPVSGEELYVSFFRQGSEPEVVEREILLPLEARVKQLDDVAETSGEVRASGGDFTVKFKPGTDIKLRQLDLERLISELIRTQPPGTAIQVDLDPLALVSRFVMYVTVTGMDDLNSLLDFIDQNITPRVAATPGVSQVLAGGGAPRELTVTIDPDRCAALGIVPEDVEAALRRSVRRLHFLGGTEDEAGRTAVVLDGRPRGEVSLADTRISPASPTLLRHVADVRLGTGRREAVFRVNGSPTVGLLIYQDAEANLVKLGNSLRDRLESLREEFRPYGIDFIVNFDGARQVEDQLNRLKRLALSGFLIALVVLYLFLRQWRAVSVVAIAVPASLLTALALLFVAGESLNVVTLFGLAVGIGMLVDNSIVVYESVQRQLERGVGPDQATEQGVRRTFRAILAASITNAVVFLPIAFTDFDNAFLRAILQVLVIAILMPLLGSVIVAVGLVPLLARRLAAPAALARLAAQRLRRQAQGGLLAPDRAREMFGALLVVALRRPGIWVTAVTVAVLVTVIIALPWVLAGTLGQEPPEATQVRFPVEIEGTGTLEHSVSVFEQLEHPLLELEGIDRVESLVREEGGSLTIYLLKKDERPEDVTAGRVRSIVRETARNVAGVDLRADASASGGGGTGGEGLGALLGQTAARVVVSGPDARQLLVLADELKARLESIPEVESASITSRSGQEEIRVLPRDRALAAFGLTADQMLPALNVVSREGRQFQMGFTLHDGREIPMTVRREAGTTRIRDDLRRLRIATPTGVLPLAAVADVRRMPPPPTIVHKNGRREVEIQYFLGNDAPQTGPARESLEREIREAIRDVHRPPGYTLETTGDDENFSWFRAILLPVLLLLFAVLAVTFESLTMPLLVLLALPLTILGTIWALLFAGMPLSPMALMGTLALIGITVNPAILLVDRMQQHAWQGGRSAGAAALAAVRERARPVLMTAATTVAGLWPLALVSGQENEIWPPFATVVMGGLVTSTVLTLLVIPVGFVFLHRLDTVFGRLGPWIVLGWIAATAAIMTPLIQAELISSMVWRFLTTILVGSVLLAAAVMIFRRPERIEPQAGADGGAPPVEARYLQKTYDLPGPLGRAWRVNERFADTVVSVGGRAFDPKLAAARLVPLALLIGGAAYLTTSVSSLFWRTVFVFVTSALVSALLRDVRRARGRADERGRVNPGGIESWLAALAPWGALGWLVLDAMVLPERAQLRTWVPIVLGLLIALIQFGRRTALKIARGDISVTLTDDRLRRVRTLWRHTSRAVFGLDLPRKPVRALSGVHFHASRGMVGILGPNGAGKTTLLRMLAGILDPSNGVVTIGGVPLQKIRKNLARYVGYLPQEFGLPTDMTARQYLNYFALLYQLEPAARRQERIEQLLKEVGLAERADEKIGEFSGGMRQRVAVARTLLRLPPIIIVDEPTVGLDPRERIRFRNLLARLAEGRVVLFSTHVVEDVEVACERVIVFARGRMVFDGPPEDLADAARGKVWMLSVTAGQQVELPDDAMIVDQVPDPSGALRNRILYDRAPWPGAESIAPSLEDGYLWLVGVEGGQ